MDKWKRNLFILYVGQFLAMASTSSITPFLPLYLQELGLTDPKKVLFWSGMIYGANLLTAFLFSPLWGRLADKYGRKMMLVRSGLGMAVTITLMGVATSPLQLLLLRLVNGVLSGFGPAAVALTATNTPKERSGYALGILHSGAVAGTICGPLLGGLLADHFGLREVFFYTGISIFAAALIVIFGVRETFEKKEKSAERTDMLQDFKLIVARKPMASMFVSSAILRAAMIGTLPLIPLYVQQLATGSDNVVVLAGITSAAMGIANMITAPHLGKLGDRIGSHRVFVYAVFGAIIFAVPQAFVHQLWQLIALRFFTGACIGGMMPSMNVLVRQYAPAGMESRTYSYVNCAVLLGGLAGSLGMGAVASGFGLPMIFIMMAALLLISIIWMRVKVFPHIAQREDPAALAGGQELIK
ncbi:MFS transporter [Paenibacillus sp. GCM10023248]|uniref:MFS transporter n=1 Tax=Bacillales TaxID=1385 RepID=UPI002378153F|nr:MULTISPECIES: MFS transporter [Bacillales]MDD9272216.1 MFS transporter [Paenibacillus sp. MAHUQ-63]MDR6884552.1 DHA1 family multidrug resistance protein-like MFS transporter [Bacillus sp. 3255]